MDFEEYREKGKEVIDYIAEYLQNIRQRRVFPDVKPGYMREIVPGEAPVKGEQWDDIFKDIERVIMPGITHWQSPHMHAYFPALNSFPSLLGDMIAEAINCLGFTWASSPAATELESLVLDWLVKCLGLPEKFLSSNQEPFGGGALQTNASDSTYYALLAARTKTFSKYGVAEIDKYLEKAEIMGRLVCYCSEQAHSSVEKAALIAITRIRLLPTDENLSLRGETLRKAIEQDKKDGLIPFYVCATLGTTGVCAFDNLEEIGPICKEEDIWLHIDAAYAGSALICPEFRKFSKGIDYATSFVFNPSKWLMVNFDCTCFWVESSIPLHQTFTVAPLYLKHKYSGAAIDYMHWQVGLSRRFRALKLWFVIRSFGIEGLQKHIYKSVELAKMFEDLVRGDQNFELIVERHLGLVVFRLKGENEKTEHLLKELNKDGRLHVVPAKVNNKYIIRFTVTSFYTTEEDIKRDWEIIKSVAYKIINSEDDKLNTEEQRKFQSSLLLSNVAQTPKIVNASFVAFFQDSDLNAYLTSKDLNYRGYTQSHLPLTPRRKPRSKNKFFSIKGTSLDQLTTAQMAKMSLISKKNVNHLGIEIDLDENLEETNGTFNEDSKTQLSNYEKETNLNGKPSITGFDQKKTYNKQSSLDSKIEHIFQIADENDADPSYDSILNRSQPNPEARKDSNEIKIKN